MKYYFEKAIKTKMIHKIIIYWLITLQS